MKDKNKKDHLNYMFREPFASGSVFSMSMIDTLIYQVCFAHVSYVSKNLYCQMPDDRLATWNSE